MLITYFHGKIVLKNRLDVYNIEYAKLILDFLATLVTSWPFIILVIVIFFHKEIGQNVTKIFELITRVKSFSAGNTSINFGQQLDQVEHENKGSNQQETKLETKPDWEFTSQEEFDKLAMLRPDFAILDSWRPIENRLSKMSKHELEKNKIPSPIGILRQLVKDGMLSENHYSYIRNIMKLRNAVVHNDVKSISYEDAYTYRDNCIEIMHILESINHHVLKNH